MDGFVPLSRHFGLRGAVPQLAPESAPVLYRDAELRKRLLTDSHSPSEYRTNGVLRNMDAFVDVFDVQPGDGMWLPEDERVQIW